MDRRLSPFLWTALSGARRIAAGAPLALAAALAACTPATDEIVSEPASPLLYEITNSQGEVEGWMLGTIHALPDGVEWRSDSIQQIIEGADYAYVEIAELNDRDKLAETFARLATTPDLPPLSQRVAPSLRATLNEIVERSDIPENSFLSTESWAAAVMLAQVDSGSDPANGVDRAIIRDFATREVRGFETAMSQLSIFDALAPEDQTDLLEGVVREWRDGREDRGRLRRAWIDGDVTVLEEATNTGIMADREVREALLTMRNKRWMTQMLYALSHEARPLVAVGAAHLVGPDGLPRLLEDQGYTVTRLD